MAKVSIPACKATEHTAAPPLGASADALERCSRIFRALGDTARLRLVARLLHGGACVSELASVEGESITTISQRLRILRAEHIVERRRSGKHLIYSLADDHMVQLISSGLAHALHGPNTSVLSNFRGDIMSTEHTIHANHSHEHGENCGHTAIQHDNHTDYLHNGHLHHPHDGHVDEHTLEVSAANPADCTDGHLCAGHDAAHTHGPDCGHEAVPHGDHTDYLVDGHLHHPHNGHCDNHGNVQLVN